MRLSPSTIAIVRTAAFAFAVLALLLSTFGRQHGLVKFAPGGSSFDTLIRPVFVAIFIVALLVALRWEIAGGLIAIFAAGGLVAFATQQLRTGSAILIILSFAVPGILWFIIDAHALSARRAALAVVGALAATAGGFLIGNFAYNFTWGPTHPFSVVQQPPDSAVLWVWSGNVDAESASVRAKARADFTTAELLVSTSKDLTSPRVVNFSDRAGNVVGFDIGNLESGTKYHYAVRFDDVVDEIRSGEFETFPTGPSSFRVVFGSCARVGSNAMVFDAIRQRDPLLYMVLGDLHYGDNDVDNVDDYRDVLDLTLTQPGQAALYRSSPIAYVWDDHDFGANDSNATSVARAAAMASYREYVPSYELAGTSSAVFQAFTIGRVRFIMTDARSTRDEQSKDDNADKSMLGIQQKEWLLDELSESADSHELVVWINPVPWIAEASVGGDNWGGYTTERAEIANFIASNRINNLLMISGDAHMVAIDDGTNTNYSNRGGTGFPLLHAAALDRPASVKGGPYSKGAIGGSGQYGMLDVRDDGDELTVTISAHSWENDELMSLRFTVDQ